MFGSMWFVADSFLSCCKFHENNSAVVSVSSGSTGWNNLCHFPKIFLGIASIILTYGFQADLTSGGNGPDTSADVMCFLAGGMNSTDLPREM